MSIYQRIKDLAHEKHISVAQIERDLNLSNGSMAKWDKHSPKSENIVAVSNYLNVTTDYLLGNEEQDNSIQYFRIDTDGLTDNEIAELKRDLEKYSKWAKEQLKDD